MVYLCNKTPVINIQWHIANSHVLSRVFKINRSCDLFMKCLYIFCITFVLSLLSCRVGTIGWRWEEGPGPTKTYEIFRRFMPSPHYLFIREWIDRLALAKGRQAFSGARLKFRGGAQSRLKLKLLAWTRGEFFFSWHRDPLSSTFTLEVISCMSSVAILFQTGMYDCVVQHEAVFMKHHACWIVTLFIQVSISIFCF